MRETCVREYVPVCPPGGLVLSVGNYADYSLPVHAGVPFPPVSVSCFVPFHSSSSHQALPYEQKTYAFCSTGRKYGQQRKIYLGCRAVKIQVIRSWAIFDGQANPVGLSR